MTPESSTNSSSTPSANMMIDEQYDYVEQVNDELNCAICHEPFVDPISHNSCGNTFCSKCIITILKCPMCSEDDFKKNCSPSAKIIRNIVDQLKVRCGMCKNIVLRGELKDHKEKYCPLHDAFKQVEQLKEQLQHEFNEKNVKLEQECNEFKTMLEKEFKEKTTEFEKAVIQDLKLKEDLLAKQKSEFDSQVLAREKLENINKPIHLNVGGTIMTVSLGTFINNEREPDNLFKKMFNGEYPLNQTPSKKFDGPIYFIDCDPIIFKHILEWLKYGSFDNEMNLAMKKTLLKSCEMFELTNISEMLNKEFNKTSICQISQFEFITLLQKKATQNLNLSGMDLRKLTPNYYNLTSSIIIESDFSGMKLKGTNFKESNFKGSNFSNCLLDSINFEGCDLSDCNFSNTIVVKCKFDESLFEGIDFKFIESNVANNSFNNCLIKNSDLNELKDLSKFKGFKFDSCLFNFNQFTNKQIENVKFENIDFKFNELKFKNIEFINCKGIIMESLIIGKNNISSTIFEETKSKFNPKLLYRGSRDGFKSIDFHSKCDNQGATLTIIKSEYDQIFGGFTSKSWQTGNGKYVSDNFAFIFKILNFGNGNYQFKKFNIKQNMKDYAIYFHNDCLSTFGYYGDSFDFIISNDCNLTNNSYSNFGSCYELPKELKYESNEAKSYLAGSFKFKVKEIEVFKIYQ